MSVITRHTGRSHRLLDIAAVTCLATGSLPVPAGAGPDQPTSSDGAGRDALSCFAAIGEGNAFCAVELGLTPRQNDLSGAYRYLIWHSDTDDGDGTGLAVSLDQEVAPRVVLFGRYGWDEGAATALRHFLSGGIGLEASFGRTADLVGCGLAWSDPHDAPSRHETVAELFYRIQLTDSLAVTGDVQIVHHPADNEDKDTASVFGIRVQALF